MPSFNNIALAACAGVLMLGTPAMAADTPRERFVRSPRNVVVDTASESPNARGAGHVHAGGGQQVQNKQLNLLRTLLGSASTTEKSVKALGGLSGVLQLLLSIVDGAGASASSAPVESAYTSGAQSTSVSPTPTADPGAVTGYSSEATPVATTTDPVETSAAPQPGQKDQCTPTLNNETQWYQLPLSSDNSNLWRLVYDNCDTNDCSRISLGPATMPDTALFAFFPGFGTGPQLTPRAYNGPRGTVCIDGPEMSGNLTLGGCRGSTNSAGQGPDTRQWIISCDECTADAASKCAFRLSAYGGNQCVSSTVPPFLRLDRCNGQSEQLFDIVPKDL